METRGIEGTVILQKARRYCYGGENFIVVIPNMIHGNLTILP